MSDYGRLTELANRHGTDKGHLGHGFAAFYEAFLRERVPFVHHVLEVGVGFGASLRMWRDYFPSARVYGWDICQREIDGERVILSVVDQEDAAALEVAWAAIGVPLDLVVDDGGHTMRQQQVTLATMLPHVKPGGVYILEDLHTSLLAGFGADAGGATTLDVVRWLQGGAPRPQSHHLSDGQLDQLRELAGEAYVFENKKSITAVFLQ